MGARTAKGRRGCVPQEDGVSMCLCICVFSCVSLCVCLRACVECSDSDILEDGFFLFFMYVQN